ncbi:unnamed protein product, partial [Rotaria magnacalcarata]
FHPFPANCKPTCDATLPASPTWNYSPHTPPVAPLKNSKTLSTTICVNSIPYTVIRLLGEGLHSRVYAAYDPRTGQSVAIKVVQNLESNDS